MKEWEKLTVSCRTELKKRMKKMDGIMPSTLCLESILAWNDVCRPTYAILEDYFCIKISDIAKEKNYYYMPIGEYRVQSLENLLDVFFSIQQGKELIFCDVAESQLAYFKSLDKYNISIRNNRGYSDYIYTMEDFEKSLEKPDARYNEKYFLRKYQPVKHSLSAEHTAACVQVIEDSFCQYHACRSCSNGCLKKTMRSFLKQLDGSSAAGVLVEAEGRYVGYAAGAMTNDEFVFLFRKNCREYRGLGEYLHRQMIEIYKDKALLVNYTEDMNLEGLRQYKKKLAPYRLSPKYQVKVKR